MPRVQGPSRHFQNIACFIVVGPKTLKPYTLSPEHVFNGNKSSLSGHGAREWTLGDLRFRFQETLETPNDYLLKLMSHIGYLQ